LHFDRGESDASFFFFSSSRLGAVALAPFRAMEQKAAPPGRMIVQAAQERQMVTLKFPFSSLFFLFFGPSP